MVRSTPRKKLQRLLTGGTFLVALVGFVLFSYVAQRFVYQNTLSQAIQDNRKMGEAMVQLFEARFENMDLLPDSVLLQNFQTTCDNIDLPNSGFVCFVQANGDMVASPGLPPNTRFNLNEAQAQFINLDRDSRKNYSQAIQQGDFEGYYEYPEDAYSDIVVAIPITSEYHLMVHQNNAGLQATAGQNLSTFLLLGLIGAVLCGGLVFWLSRLIVTSYENELELKNDNMHAALQEIEAKNEFISAQQTEITDSIRYAQRIQESVMAQTHELDQLLPSYFLIDRPKDVVSGDFCWVGTLESKLIVAVGDCTGHGVPGAFMSLIANSWLERIINTEKISDPSVILEKLHRGICATLKQDSTQRPDGVDIAITVLDPEANSLTFSGAMSPVYLLIEGEIQEIATTKKPIGGSTIQDGATYKNHIYPLNEVETVYLSSDGYQDQFGGDQGRKYLKKNFRTLLQEISELSAKEQKQRLQDSYEAWTQNGAVAQVDDILILSFSLKPFWNRSGQQQISQPSEATRS